MMPFGMHSASCSCTGCVYRSRSKEPNIQQIIQEGSEIDKLYYGKFLPLRERKLLEKLIRTRDVYNDVRSQLLSSAGSDCACKDCPTTACPAYKKKRYHDSMTDTSSTVLEMVDRIDRGHTSKLSSCCSCCSCETLRKIRKRMKKEQKKHPRVYRQIVTCEDIAKYCAEAEERGRKRRKKLSTKISSKIGSARLKIKKHLSEPCACGGSLSSASTHKSKSLKSKIRSRKKAKEAALSRKVMTIDQETESTKVSRKPRKKSKDIQSSSTKDSATELKNPIAFKIKKDSLILFKEKLLKKRSYDENQDVECKPGTCDVGKCMVEECNKKIKAKTGRVMRKRKSHSRHSDTDRDRSRVSVSSRTKTMKVRESRVQHEPCPCPHGPCPCESKRKSFYSMTTILKSRLKQTVSKLELKSKKPKQRRKVETVNVKQEKLSEVTKSAGSMTSIPKSKTKAQSAITEEQPATKQKNKTKLQLVAKEKGLEEKKVKVKQEKSSEVPKSAGSMTLIPKLKTKAQPAITEETPATIQKNKTKLQLVAKEKKLEEKERKVNVKQEKSLEVPRSPGSMTSTPKSKTIAQSAITEETATKSKNKAKLQLVSKDKELEEKEKVLVQVSPKSNLGNINCDCKSFIKSTSTIKSSPKQKVSKVSPKISRQKSKRDLHQNLDEVDLQESEEHVKVKREKRMKPTHGRIKQHKKYHKSQSIESQESYLRESASQVSKPYGRNVLPSPRECEPLMCIPYECDPKKCAQIFKSHGKSAVISMDHLRRKSVGSAAFSKKIRSRSRSKSRSKSKHNVSKSAESVVKKTKYISRNSRELPPLEIVEKNTGAESSQPDSQAVKISSSFSFNIEFYKDTYPDECVCVEKLDKKEEPISGYEKKTKQKEHRRKYKDHGTEYNSSKDHGTGYVGSYHNTSSQSSSSQSSTNVQVGHKLKRCFCTLKILQKKKQKISHAVSKKTMASLESKELATGPRRKRTQTKLSGIAYVVPPVTSPRTSLLPYECEPGFCIPGECNPYECAERIKQRNRRARKHSKETNTAITPTVSAFTSQPMSKSTSRKIQSSENRKIKQKGKYSQSQIQSSENRNIKQKGRYSQPQSIEPKISSDKSEKQAVRIGSNISLSIEFSKSNIIDDRTENVLISDMPRKKDRKHLQQKGVKAHKPRVRHEISETTTSDVKSKQTYTEPFLRRCFCTLKLLKKNKKKIEPLSPWRNKNEYVMHMQKESVTTNRAEIRYNHERSKIPYEFGAGLCPYPYNYEKFLKLHQMKLQQKYSNLVELGSRPKFSKTSKTITASKSRNTQSYTRQSRQKVIKNTNRDNYGTYMPSHSKQQIGQVKFHFNDNLINKHTHNEDKLDTIGSLNFDRLPHHTFIDAEVSGKEKESSLVSTVKRYFSTLKFQKKRNKAGLENNSNMNNERIKILYPLPNPHLCDYKSPRTRLNRLPYNLGSYKYAPNSCTPGICDSHDCYERNKRREIKELHDRYLSRNKHERISNISTTRSDFSTQSRLLKNKTNKDQKVNDKQKYMKAAVGFPPSPQAVRRGSDFSYNKEISINRFVTSNQDNENRKSYQRIKNQAEKYNTVSELSIKNTMKKYMTDKHVPLKYSVSQANKFRQEVKTSNVGFLLKKCLCTLGLQKKNLPHSEFPWQQPITTQFVQVEHKNKIDCHNVTKAGTETLNKPFYKGEALRSKLSEGLNRENINNQNSLKNLQEFSPQRPKSSSYSKRVHIRSSIDLNFDKMRSLMNPFYKSFYALHFKLSKSKNKPREKYHDNEREPGDCAANECDPDDCSKRMNRLKRLKKAMAPNAKLEPDCYEKCKEQFENKKKVKKGYKPLILGSNMSFRAGVYKDKDPYKNKRQQAVRVGSDVKVNFDFFKEPHTRNIFVTGPLPPKPVKKSARQKRQVEESDSNDSVLSHVLQKCFCSSKMKKAYSAKSDINQNTDVDITGKVYPRRKSTTRLKRKESLKSKSFQYKDYTQKQHKYSRRKERNNVRFCTNVNCLEYYDGQGLKQRVRVIGRGDGDAEKQKQYDSEPEKTVVDKCVCESGKKKSKKKIFKMTNIKKKIFKMKNIKKKKIKKQNIKEKNIKKLIDECYCKLKKGKKLGQKPSMETILADKKICKELARAEREMETIMPYSKKKFKKVPSQPELDEGKQVCPKCRTDQNQIQKTTVLKTKDTGKENKNNTCLCPPPLKHSATFNCECGQVDKCPVCRAKELGTFNRKKMKQPCTCMEEPKKEEPKKDLSKCPMCKQNYKKNVSKCPCCKKPFASGTGESVEDKKVKQKMLDLNKPLFQMTVNKTNMRIVNKDEVIKKMGSSAKAIQKAQKAIEQTKYHTSKCKCCICVAKRKGQQNAGPNFNIDARKLKPCICGSVVCKKDWEKIKQEQRSRAAVKIKKCVCGSNICGEESQKMPEMLLEAAKQAEHDKEMAKRATLKEKQYQIARKKRRKEREKAFKQQMKARKKHDNYELKSIRNTVNAGSIALLAESLIDLGTFGSKAFCDIAKYVYKGVIHPRDAISDVKDAISDPNHAMKTIAKSAEGMGLQSTIKRIKERFIRMPVATSAISVMESYPATNYLVHMADKDPHQRMKKFQSKRNREPLDFECSLYMASMRKRPCLRIYYMCPWFYPHCMSLLQLWKQLLDILLFVLAVLVWSPCIICMEICRGCVCCIACQG